MKKLVVALTLALALPLISGCSTRNLEAGPQVAPEDVQAVFADIMGGGAAGFSGGANVLDEMTDLERNEFARQTKLYFVANDASRPAVSVLALNDTGWIDSGFSGLTIHDLVAQYVDVIFLDGFDADNNRRFGLAMRLEGPSGGVVTFASASELGDYTFTDDSFETAIEGANGERVVLKTRDLSKTYSDELGSAIKLEVWIDGYYAGQISAMSSYSFN